VLTYFLYVLLVIITQKTQEGHAAPKKKTLQKYVNTFKASTAAPGVLE
jgi:hypothetical protein